MAMNGFTKDMNIIQKLNDEPNDRDGLTAGELKAKFDEGGLAVKDYLNNTVRPYVNTMDENTSAHAANTNNPHSVTAAQVGLGNVPNVATNDQTPTYTAASSLTALTSGEKLSVAFGKLKKAVADLISHIANTSNPHSVTYTQTGAAAASHNHSASNITSGTLPVARGGTGQTTASSAATALLSAMPSGTANMTDDTLIATTKTDGTATWYQRSATYLWGYIKGKADAVYAALSHTHGAGDITSGTLPVARGGTGNSTGYVTVGQKSGTTLGTRATAEGVNTTASGVNSHAEGSNTIASGVDSHAEGFQTTASGSCSHTEGSNTVASGYSGAHAEGDTTTASGEFGPHAEGVNTVASGHFGAHAEGEGTIAAGVSQHVFGKFNVSDTSNVEIVGWGTSSTRKNIRTLDQNGNMTIAGKLTLGAGPTEATDAATKQYVDAILPYGSRFTLNHIVFPVNQDNISINTGTNLRTANLRQNYMESEGHDLGGSTYKCLVLTTGRVTPSTTNSSFVLYKSDFKAVPKASGMKLVLTLRRYRADVGESSNPPQIFVATYNYQGKIYWNSIAASALGYYGYRYILDDLILLTNGNVCVFVQFRRPTHAIKCFFDLDVVAADSPVTGGTSFSSLENSGFTVQDDPT